MCTNGRATLAPDAGGHGSLYGTLCDAGPDTDPVLTELVASLREFAHGCAVQVVAEGVETAEEHAVLRDLGVDFGQGRHYGRPGPPEALGDTPAVRIPVPRREPALPAEV